MRNVTTGWMVGLGVAVALTAVSCSDESDDEAGTGGHNSSSNTGGTTSSGSDADAYVSAHNAVRTTVAEPTGYAGSWESLPPVSWSNEVAASAQEWANHLRDTLNCGLQHDQGSGYGENLAMGTGLTPEGAVNMWAGEETNYNYESPYRFDTATGHYTQIVWRETVAIGCASASCGNANVVVCRYSPPGNMVGGEIF